VSSPADGRRQLSSFYTCRDYLSDDLLSRYGAKGRTGSGSIDTTRLRLLIGVGLTDDTAEEWKQSLYDAKRIINIYEEVAGFSRTSVLTRVNYMYNGKKSSNVKHCWLLTGPEEWMRYSQLVSMVTLILRTVTRYKQASEVETIEQVEEYWQRLIKESNANGAKPGLRHADTSDYLPRCWQKFHMMMRWFDKIFTLSGEKAHKDARNWHSRGGINSLCTFNTGLRQIDEPMREAWEEWRKKYPNT